MTAEKQFVPETADGIVSMKFTFNGADLAGKTVVAFETVSSGGKEVFVHADLEDEDQTVKLYAPPIHPKGPRTGDMSNAAVWIFTLMAATAGIAGTIIYRKRHPGK